MSKRPRNAARYLNIEEANNSGTSVSVPFSVENVCDANKRKKHKGMKNSTASHENNSRSQKKRQKCDQDRSSANTITAETTRNENQCDHSNQISRGQAFYQRNRQGMFFFS